MSLVADWDPGVVRYYIVDQLNGDDANMGYIDAARGAILNPAGIAKKTHAGLMAILPRAGAGRTFAILYVNRDYVNGTTFAEDFEFGELSGYRQTIKRGSTDGTNSVEDKRLHGAMIAVPGPNVDLSWTVLSSTVDSITVEGPALPTEVDRGGINGFRIRMVGNVTAGLANLCFGAHRNDDSKLTFWRDEFTIRALPLAQPGDKLFIEKPGIRAQRYREMMDCGMYHSITGQGRMSVTSGIEMYHGTGIENRIGCRGEMVYSFMHASSVVWFHPTISTPGSVGTLAFRDNPQYEVGDSVYHGTSFRCLGGYRIAANDLLVRSFYGLTLSADTENEDVMAGGNVSIGAGSMFRGIHVSGNPGSGYGTPLTNGAVIGQPKDDVYHSKPIRVVDKGLEIKGNGCHIWGISGEGCSTPVVKIQFGGHYLVDNVVNGPNGGNADVGLDISAMAAGGQVRVGTQEPCNASGTVGEIRTASGLTTWASLNAGSIEDANYTRLVGSVGAA